MDNITITWDIEDVLQQDNTLTIEQAREVLQMLKQQHDACIGINWDVIDCTIDSLKRGL